MIKAVLDSNVLVSGLISSKGAPSEILDAWRRRKFFLLTSEEIIRETQKVLNYPRIKNTYSLTPEQINRFLSNLRKYSFRISGSLSVNEITDDPEDNKILACALEGGAKYIVSGDVHLKNLRSFKGVKIVTPTEFEEILAEKE